MRGPLYLAERTIGECRQPPVAHRTWLARYVFSVCSPLQKGKMKQKRKLKKWPRVYWQRQWDHRRGFHGGPGGGQSMATNTSSGRLSSNISRSLFLTKNVTSTSLNRMWKRSKWMVIVFKLSAVGAGVQGKSQDCSGDFEWNLISI